MIGDSVLGKIVGPNLFFSPSGSDQASPMRRIFFRFLKLLFVEQSGAKDGQGFLLVLLFAATLLAADDFARGNMEDLNRGMRGIHALATRPPGSTDLDAKIFGPDFDIDFFRFWK